MYLLTVFSITVFSMKDHILKKKSVFLHLLSLIQLCWLCFFFVFVRANRSNVFRCRGEDQYRRTERRCSEVDAKIYEFNCISWIGALDEKRGQEIEISTV